MPLFISIIILGIVEGITEFLPISSTAHLLIAQNWLPKQSELFNVVIQAGAVLAVIPLFKVRFYQFYYRPTDPATLDYLKKFFVAVMITGVGGLIMDKKGLRMRAELEVDPSGAFKIIGWALLIGGIVFLLVELFVKGKKPTDYVTWKVAIAVGIGQLIAAAFPGASRSGSTIMLALILGLSRVAATEFSFLVSIPTMLAASALTLFKTLHHPDPTAHREDWEMLLLGCVVAALVSFIAVKWLLHYVQSHTFNAFGWYRIVVGILVLVFLAQAHHQFL